MTRELLQQEAVNLMMNNKHVILQWCTGLGKSKASIDIINALAKQEFEYHESPLNVLLVIAEKAHKNNWEMEFEKWGVKTDNIDIVCYASLKNYKNSIWDLIIFDEAHHLGSDIRLDILNSITFRHSLYLSATISKELLAELYSINKYVINTVTLNDAIINNILPKPDIYTIPLLLDNNRANCIIVEERGTSKNKRVIKCSLEDRWIYLKDKATFPNIRLEIKCTEQQKYNYLTDQYDYWQRQYIRTRMVATKNKWLQYGLKRKKFLGEIKSSRVKTLLAKLKDTRYICFCSSIEQAESFDTNNCIHSKKNNSLDIINSFNNKSINSIYAVGMLQEGANLTDIEAGIIVQLDGQERAFIQKFGRSLRAKNPKQFIFYFKNTKDVDYLNNVLEGIDNEFIEVIKDLKTFKL